MAMAVRSIVRTLLAGAAGVVPGIAHAACADFWPGAAAKPGVRRDITPDDLVRLRDIGFPDASVSGMPAPLAVSPDGRNVAFVISRADPADNGLCRGLAVVVLKQGGAARLIDRGGDLAPQSAEVRGLFANYGTPLVATPAWSPDGRSIAYLKPEHGITQVWRIAIDGNDATAATAAPFDLESVDWRAQRLLSVTARPGALASAARVEEEGRSGWLYDARFMPSAGPGPRLTAKDAPLVRFTVDSVSMQLGTVEAEAKQRLTDAGVALRPENGSPVAALRLWWSRDGGTQRRCDQDTCGGALVGGWWTHDRHAILFQRREGWRNEETALYRWDPDSRRAPRLVLRTRDVLTGCQSARDGLVCLEENSTTPRRIVVIDPASGRSRLVFDPNPEFTGIALAPVTRLRWRNDQGLEVWGDLVLPRDRRAGEKVPMVVVQYHSRGFLRGGTGDEYPIFALAARGLAVLSIERPLGVATSMPGLTTVAALNAAMTRGWAERRSIQSALAEGVRSAVATGTIDAARIGITGLSDGATAARFALINSHLFVAASISTCCIEPVTTMTLAGPAFADESRALGYPDLTRPDADFWRPASLVLNAARITTPLLMNVADDEYLLSLEAVEALREHHQPVEMYVFPGEHHNKWQPSHRRAIYERNIDWFDFWLRRHEDSDPAKRRQYERWEEMRDRRGGQEDQQPG